jgi:hypothetical protein
MLGDDLFGQHPINGKLIMSSSPSGFLRRLEWAGGKLKECCPDIILLACWPKVPPLSSSIDFERARFLLFRVAGFQKRG